MKPDKIIALLNHNLNKPIRVRALDRAEPLEGLLIEKPFHENRAPFAVAFETKTPTYLARPGATEFCLENDSQKVLQSCTFAGFAIDYLLLRPEYAVGAYTSEGRLIVTTTDPNLFVGGGMLMKPVDVNAIRRRLQTAA